MYKPAIERSELIKIYSNPDLWRANLNRLSVDDLKRQRDFFKSDVISSTRAGNLARIAAIVELAGTEAAAVYTQSPRTALMGLLIGAGLGLFSWISRENAVESQWMSQEITAVLENQRSRLAS